MSRRYTLDEIAAELGVDRQDVFTIAEADVDGVFADDDVYDEETVNEVGRHALIEHFSGGADPE